ncbi:YtxH domain-containing protein [Paenibacillus lutrae]|uniref:YtxH domain-containing protein n=1 Tax=Paenibacillus lutrae TaxID=2078573 RepID=A0A7X3FFH0_9BACL|nr:YtxH domain-containing protein [Paenibacillus lutrae]MVO98456.1 YtxH domain-containing protein [Paenibacillus lutrae]
MARTTRGKDLIYGAVFGSVAGAVTALLLAPKSGKELRADIAQQAAQVSEKTQEIARTVGEKTSDLVDKAKEATASVTAEVRSWRDRGCADAGKRIDEEIAASEAAQDLVIIGK